MINAATSASTVKTVAHFCGVEKREKRFFKCETKSLYCACSFGGACPKLDRGPTRSNEA